MNQEKVINFKIRNIINISIQMQTIKLYLKPQIKFEVSQESNNYYLNLKNIMKSSPDSIFNHHFQYLI